MDLSVSEQLAYTTTRIVASLPDGLASVGTGFFYAFRIGEATVPVILTNKHVIDGAVSITFQLTKASADRQPITGDFVTIELNISKSDFDHPDPAVDLCGILLGPTINESEARGTPFFHVSLNDDLIATPEDLTTLTALEDVVMVGYPAGLWDSHNNMPVFRKGVTATHPNIDYEGRQEFLIDMACFHGSSGSPVILYNSGSYSSPGGGLTLGTRLKLLGVLYAGPQFTTEGELKIVPVPTVAKTVAVSHIPMNVGVVLKAARIAELQPVVQSLLAIGQFVTIA